MKNKLYKIGLLFTISLFISLFVSCSNDEIENEENADAKFKIQAESSTQTFDSIKVNIDGMYAESEGDPSNPKPPRRE